MLNILWGIMILVGIFYATLTGNLGTMTETILQSAGEAVTLAISMLGVIGMWSGFLEIADGSGLIAGMTRGMRRPLQFLFPDVPEDHPAREYIAVNMIANIMGLGWAATPAGLQAMKELKNLEEESGRSGNAPAVKGGHIPRASNAMCTFLVINISSLQLIPVNMIAYRNQYGSAHSASIIVPGFIATVITTLAGVVYCKIMQKMTSS